jgi:hypothetical protein
MKCQPFRSTVLAVSTLLLACLIVACAGAPKKHSGEPFKDVVHANADKMFVDGRQVFRFDTFGDEAFWGGKLRLHEPIAGEKHCGKGPGLTPKQSAGSWPQS